MFDDINNDPLRSTIMGGPGLPATRPRLDALAAQMKQAGLEDRDWRSELDRASWGLRWEDKLMLRVLLGENE